MNTQEANAELTKKVAAIQKAIEEATEFADAHRLSFTFDGPAYGMGGSYHARTPRADGWDSSSSCYGEDEEYEGGWSTSSQSC